MSWLFSRALVEAFSAGICSDGEPCAQLNVMPTARSFWRRGNAMEFSDLFPFGPMWKRLTVKNGEALLMSCLEAFRVPTSAPREKALASTGKHLDFGGKWPASWVKFDPDTCSWKTAQCSLVGGSEPFSGIWPRSGLMRDGMCFELPTLAYPIVASASGFSLPTPSGVNGGKNNVMGRIDEWGGSSNPLRGTVIGSMCLPEFEEMVMGWPIGWTELTPYETGKFHEWQQQHGDCLVDPEQRIQLQGEASLQGENFDVEAAEGTPGIVAGQMK